MLLNDPCHRPKDGLARSTHPCPCLSPPLKTTSRSPRMLGWAAAVCSCCLPMSLVALPATMGDAEGTPARRSGRQPAILSGCPGRARRTWCSRATPPPRAPARARSCGASPRPCPAGAGVLRRTDLREDDDSPANRPPTHGGGRTIALRGSVSATGRSRTGEREAEQRPGRARRKGAPKGGGGRGTREGELLLTEGRRRVARSRRRSRSVVPRARSRSPPPTSATPRFASLVDAPAGEGSGGHLQAGHARLGGPRLLAWQRGE